MNIQLPPELGGGSVPLHNNNIIAICGERRRGKDHLTNFLVQKYGAVRLSFSDEVRKVVHKVFPWLDVFNIKDDQKDVPFEHPFNPYRFTPRDITKMIGKIRDIHPQVFVYEFLQGQYKRALENPDTLFVITDFRTIDEWVQFIKPFNVPTVKIISKKADSQFEPDSFEDFIRAFEADHVYDNTEMNGTDDFQKFFEWLALTHNLTKGFEK